MNTESQASPCPKVGHRERKERARPQKAKAVEVLKPGDRVKTPDRKLVGGGVILAISECGRYARVRKHYGRRCHFTRFYKVGELEKY